MISYISQKNCDNATRKILITKLCGAPYDGVFSYLYGILSHIDLSSGQVDLYVCVIFFTFFLFSSWSCI